MINVGLRYEILKLKSNHNVYRVPIILFLILLTLVFFLAHNFGPKYLSAVNFMKVSNVVDYFYNKLFLFTGISLSFFIVFSAYLIYQIEHLSYVNNHFLSFKVKQNIVLNHKLKLHLAITLLFVLVYSSFICAGSIFAYLNNPDYANYTREAVYITLLKHNSLFIIKSFNCCVLIRLFNKIVRNNILNLILYLAVFLNNLIPNSNFLNFFYITQQNFASTLFVALVTSLILLIIYLNENRIFKT